MPNEHLRLFEGRLNTLKSFIWFIFVLSMATAKKYKISILTIVLLMAFSLENYAQRNYASTSVLSTGNWYKIAITKEGIYKIDLAFLSRLGINASQISSTSIQLFGNGGAMLEEKNNTPLTDDLIENAIEVIDGGDGILNGNDYFIFYAPGPHRWLKDSVNKRFRHQKNLVNDTCFYFLTIADKGKRIAIQKNTGPSNIQVVSFNERIFHENDSVNLLNSGKNWYGEIFDNNHLSHSFKVEIPNLELQQPVHISSSLIGRSIATAAKFTMGVNGQSPININIDAVTGNLIDGYAKPAFSETDINSTTNTININYTFSASTTSSQGWLDWFEVQGRRTLILPIQDQLSFRDWSSVGPNKVAEFVINNTSADTEVWEVNQPLAPLKMDLSSAGTQSKFVNESNELKEYIAFTKNQLAPPIAIGKITNQNLHLSSSVDYLIISPNIFLSEAQRLANFHQQQYRYTVKVVSAEQVYNEFGGGNINPVAIRNFIKMYFDKAGNDTTKRPRFVLLFGAGSYTLRNSNSEKKNFIPCYESNNSLDPLSTYTTDDFYALLKDEDDINTNSTFENLDLAIGRLPITSIYEAKTIVDKIIRYHAKESLGDWRNNLVFVADDKDANTFLNNAEKLSKKAGNTNSLFNTTKIYVDAYPLKTILGNSSSPQVNQAIVEQFFAGNVLFNYSGHGNFQQLSAYAILSKQEAKLFNNPNKLPLLITSTCDFVPFDDPKKSSLGGSLLLNNANGVIGLLTTPRLVFASSNEVIHENFIKFALEKNSTSNYSSLGESFRKAKNYTSLTFSDIINKRKFSLIGDPGIQLAFPKYSIKIISINQHPISEKDTLQSGKKYEFTGEVRNESGLVKEDFNGTVYPKIFDLPAAVKTLGSDAKSIATTFFQQTNTLFKGKATVNKGKFSFTMTVPKDLPLKTGRGRMSLYAENGITDANGIDSSFFIGGVGNNLNADNKGPLIQPYLNNYQFINGGTVNDCALLLVKLSDNDGINTIGNGHDITAIIDGDDRTVYLLNNFYETELDNYQRGNILFQLPSLTEGKHRIKIKAWDNQNNFTEVVVEFYVSEERPFKISRLMNYPNPFNSKTNFSFEHNQPGESLQVSILIYSIEGMLVQKIQKNIQNAESRVNEISLEAPFLMGAKFKKGIYFYQITVTNSVGQVATASQKMMIL